MPLRSVDAIYRDEDGLLWLGTNGQGLQVLDDRGAQLKALTFRVRDGLFDGEIYGIVPDDQGRLWMACSKGIFSVARAELAALHRGTDQDDFEHAVQSHRRLPRDRVQAGSAAGRVENARRADLVLHHPRADRDRPGAPQAQRAAAAGGD